MTKYATYAHIGLAGLGALGKITEDRINANQQAVMTVLRKVDLEKKYKIGDTLSFDDIDKIYNVGISDDEKRAWVWYRLNNGVPMKGGWKKYYPPSGGSVNEDVIVTTKATEILDNAYRLITTVPKGTQLGRPTKFKNQYGNKNMLIFVAPDGAKRWVNAADVTTKQVTAQGSENYVAQLVKKGVLFYMDGVYFPYAIYAYGNMYERELQLKADREFIEKTYGKDVYNEQAKIIERCKPRLISINNPAPTERPYISVISRFAREEDEAQIQSFFITNLREETGIDLQGYVREKRQLFRSSRKVKKEKTKKKQAVQDAERAKYANADEAEEMNFTLVEAYKIYLRTLPRTDFKEVSAEQIIYYYIEGGRLSKDADEAERETIEKFTPIEGEELFAKFLYEALQFEDQQKLDFLWNRIYNGFSSIPHHKVPIGFECSALFKSSILEFTPAQREAIAFMEIAGSGILAYDVGVGKTMSAIITMANNMQAGKYDRPLLIVPNPTYKNWIREINGYTDPETGEIVSGVMSGLNIKINEYYNLGSKVKLVERPAKGSISIMTYEGFALMGLSSKVSSQMVDELEKILMQEDDDSKSERDRAMALQKIREVVGEGNKNTVIDIDTYGFDALIIDEAHNFKNIFDRVSPDENGDKRYDLTASQSKRGIGAFFHCNYIQRTFGANVMLLTATPFTNSPLEIFSMLSLVGYKSIKDMGYYNIQRFMQNFVLQSLEYVNSYDGEIELRPVVKSYKNRLVLQNLIHNHIAYKTGEEAGVKRPVKINLPRIKVMREGKFMDLPKDEQILTYLKPTIEQQANQADIYSAARNSRKLGEIGRALNKSLDNALSPYLYDSSPSKVGFMEFVEGSPKIHYTMLCIKSVKEWHESRGQQCSGQVIYINRGKDFFPHMKRYLEDVIGYKKDIRLGNKRFDEVEIIMSGMSNEAKEGIKDAFLSGIVKVIIGTATIREGINLQKRGSVLYNLYPDWNPTDIRQLEGRIWRQGNQFGYVRIVMPLLQDSMDVFVFQKLQEKTARINDIWYRSDRGNVLDQEALDPEEIKFALYTDINALVKMRLDQVKKDIARRLSINTSNIEIMNKITTTMSEYSANRDACMVLIRAANAETARIMSAYQNDWKVWYQQIKNVFPFSSAINGDEKKAKAIFEKYIDYNKDSTEFLAQIAIDDKLVKSLAAKAIDNESMGQKENSWDIMQKRNTVGRFMMALSKLRKAENTILKERGYNLNSNIKGIIDELKLESVTLENEMKNLESDEWFKKNYEDIAEYKAKTAIFGESPEKRATQFATLNNLLAYSAQEEVTKGVPRSRGFALPENKVSQPVDADKFKKLKLLKLKLKLQTQTLILKQKQAA